MIQYLRVLVNNDHPVTLLSPQDGEFMNFKVAGQWYSPQKPVSEEVDYIINQFNFYPHVIRSRNDPIFGKLADSHYQNTVFFSPQDGTFMNSKVRGQW
jgi:hypothetical protein